MRKTSDKAVKKPQKVADEVQYKIRSPCPVAAVLDVMGDKWTLLVIRDLLMGKQTYKEFQHSPEGIPTNILAERLKRLHRAGIVEKKRYQERPDRYHYLITEKGKELWPVLKEMMHWGNKYVDGTIGLSEASKMFKNL